MKRKLIPIRVSDLYWVSSCIFSLLFLLGYYANNKNYWVFFLATLMFIVSLIIGFNKKIQDSLNYEKEVKK